jgi:hypothetical protein
MSLKTMTVSKLKDLKRQVEAAIPAILILQFITVAVMAGERMPRLSAGAANLGRGGRR